MAKDKILAMDIGNDSLKIAEFSEENGALVLEKFAFTEYNISESDAIDSLPGELATLMKNNGFTAKKVYLSVSGQSSFIRFVKLPPMGNDPEKVKKTVEFEARQNVPFPMDEVVWDYQLIGSPDDVEMDSVFVVIKKDDITSITNVLEAAGLDVELIEISPTASYNSSVANEIGTEECAMLLNIGSRCSTLTFIDHGKLFIRTIPIGGQTITQQIAKEFNIPFLDAEDMKRRHGFVALGGAYEEPDSEVAATVSKIVRNIMTRLHGEINRSINVYRSQQKGKRPGKLYLAGGSSVMAFTQRFFSEKLRMDVEYFNPFGSVRFAPTVNKEKLAEVAHMFSDVIGLGLRYATTCPIEISLIPDDVKNRQELRKKVPYFYYSATTLLLCLGLVYSGVKYQSSLEEKYINESNKTISETSENAKKLDEIKKRLKDLNVKYDVASKLLTERGDWVVLLNQLEKILPKHTWLTSFGTADLSKDDSSAPKKKLSIFGRSKNKTTDDKADVKVDYSTDSIEIAGYTTDRNDLDKLNNNLNKASGKEGSLFAGGEEKKGATTLETSVVKVNDLEVYKFKIKLKLTKTLK
jgi:type IV pilus assembly protein PilM